MKFDSDRVTGVATKSPAVLQLHEAVDAGASQSLQSAIPDMNGEASAAERTILLIDDNPSLTAFLTADLTLAGYRVLAAGHVEEAVQILRCAPVRAVILDVRLEETGGVRSGLEVLIFLRAQKTLQKVPVLVLTGQALNTAEEEAIRAGGAYVFYKPEGYPALRNYLRRLTAGEAE